MMPAIRSRITGLTCRGVFMEHERVLSLDFGRFMLSLDSSPEAPGLSFSGDRVRVAPKNPSWEHHLKGATATGASQSGMDRVLVIEFERNTVYDHGPCTLHFEMTGRNANIILCRKTDDRIIACFRKVSSRQNRYRTISPGIFYTPPPPSGFPPERWHESVLPPEPSPMDLCRVLEGIGPATARAILSRALATGDDVRSVLLAVAQDLMRESVPDWIGGQPGPSRAVDTKAPGTTELSARLSRERKELTKKLAASEQALGNLEQPDTFRMWGNLILTFKNDLTKGMERVVLTDYHGNAIKVPLKKALNPPENAARFFRKAAGVNTERERLEGRIRQVKERLSELEDTLARLPEMSPERITELLGRPEKRAEARKPREFVLEGGWRCIAGRNARENEELTFRTAARDDFWLHARGASGSHVILRRDGRPGNPPERVLQLAADIAARHSGQKGIIPVDCTLVKYVRRVKGAPQGFVKYTNEKTLFATVE
jgi:predicted ribosome quality control (RQC) complex YloA/Tae2 family protein